jgi:hypothetical protein
MIMGVMGGTPTVVEVLAEEREASRTIAYYVMLLGLAPHHVCFFMASSHSCHF